MKKPSNKSGKGNSFNNPSIYRRIYENSLPEVLIFYSDYRFIAANPPACSLFGMTEEDLCLHFLTDMVDYNDPRLINLVEVAERTGKTNGEITLVRKNGSKFTCEINSSTFRNENGELIIDIVIRELINRKNEEEELNKIFALYQLAIDASTDGIWDMDMRTNRVFLSPNALNWLGFKESKLLHGDELHDNIIHKEDMPVIENEFNTITNGKTDIIDSEFRVNTVSAGWKWIRLRGKVVLRDREGKIIRMLGTFDDISNRKLLEKELERKQKEFQSYFDFGPVGQVIILPDKSWIAINQKACQLIGYTKEELTRLNWIDLSHPEDVQKSLVLFNQVLEGKIDNYSFEKRYIRKDGSIMFAHLHVVCSRNEDGSVNHFISSFLDITEQKKYEESIRNERKILRTLVDNLPVTIYIIDREGRKVLSNKADWEIIGSNDETEVLGKTDIELYPGKIGERCHADNMFVINNKTSILNREEEFTDKEGRLKWLLTTKVPLFDANNQIAGLIGIGLDITEQKNLQQKIAESETFYRTLVNTSPDGVVVTDLTGKITFISKRTYQNFKIPERENRIGDSIFNWVAPGSRAMAKACFLESLEDKGPLKPQEIKFLNYDKSEFWGELSSSPLLDSSGKTIGLMVVGHDITARKKIEVDLVSAKNKAEEHDKLKTAFLHNISHEIRTPLNAIVGFSSLMDDMNLSSDQQKSYIETIIKSSDHLLEIINGILEISNIEAGIVKVNENELDLNNLVEDLFNQFNLDFEKKNIQLSFGIREEKIIIRSDKTKLVQILSNLLSNALKFTDTGIVKFGYRVNANNIQFYVSDTGKGIPQNKFHKIFDRFYQVEHSENRLHEGTGLGLSICKAYVELLDGNIWLTSEVGKGTTFYFSIPVNRIKTTLKSNENYIDEKSNLMSDKTILLAEDDDINYRLLYEILQSQGPKIIRAKDGIEAIEIVKSVPEIDLILMDIKMPHLDGFEATRKIKDIFPDIPVIALTAYSSESDKKNASNIGFTDFISKPYSRKVLIDSLNRILK